MPAVLRRCPPSCHVASKAAVLGSKNWPRSYSSAVSTRNWLVGTEENRSSKKKPYTTSITRFRDMSTSRFPALPHRLLQLWLYRRETCGFRPGMAIKSSDALVWWYSSWVPRPSVFLLIQPWPLQQPTVFESNRKKQIPLGHELPFFLLAFSPSQADRLFFFPTLPSRPISPTKLSVPTPKCLYSYLTSKYTLASFKTLVLWKHVVSYLEARWECLFCTVL